MQAKAQDYATITPWPTHQILVIICVVTCIKIMIQNSLTNKILHTPSSPNDPDTMQICVSSDGFRHLGVSCYVYDGQSGFVF